MCIRSSMNYSVSPNLLSFFKNSIPGYHSQIFPPEWAHPLQFPCSLSSRSVSSPPHSPLRQFHPITWRSSLFGYFITISSLIYEEPLPAPPPTLLSILLLKHRKGTFKASVLAYTLFSLSLSIPTISTPPLNNAVFICLFRSPLQLNPWAFSSWANLNWYPFRFQTFRSCPKIYSPSFPPFPTVFPQQWFLIVLLFLSVAPDKNTSLFFLYQVHRLNFKLLVLSLKIATLSFLNLP